jgi:hypothetical protein
MATCMHSPDDLGMCTQQRTLLKRLRMRPMGVVSKNMTCVPTSLCSEFWCTCQHGQTTFK